MRRGSPHPFPESARYLPFLVGILVVVFSACTPRWPERPNIILISVDSLRADHLGAYGYARDTSPHIDRMAADAVVFETAYSTTSWTLPSHFSMLTGLYPEVHGVQGGKQRLGDDTVLVSQVLQEMGYQTAAVVAGLYLHQRFGFNRGWDLYDGRLIRPRRLRSSPQSAVTPEEHDIIVDILDQFADGPFFLFLHYWDVHYDYIPPPPWDRKFDPDYSGELTGEGFYKNDQVYAGMEPRDLSWIQSLYDGEIALTDDYLGRLFSELDRRGLYEDSLILFVADHGDEFFEHGRKGHRANLYNGTLRVPLVIRFPGGRWSGTRVDRPVSLVDIAPTILEVAGAEPLERVNGHSLAAPPDADDGLDTRPIFADLNDLEKAVIRDGWKLIVSPRSPQAVPELFDLRRDPAEQDNLYAAEEARAAALRHDLDLWLALSRRQRGSRSRGTVEYDAETQEALEALGYVD